jgi:hypothetical protein
MAPGPSPALSRRFLPSSTRTLSSVRQIQPGISYKIRASKSPASEKVVNYEGTTYNSHFFMRIVTLVIMWTGLP